MSTTPRRSAAAVRANNGRNNGDDDQRGGAPARDMGCQHRDRRRRARGAQESRTPRRRVRRDWVEERRLCTVRHHRASLPALALDRSTARRPRAQSRCAVLLRLHEGGSASGTNGENSPVCFVAVSRITPSWRSRPSAVVMAAVVLTHRCRRTLAIVPHRRRPRIAHQVCLRRLCAKSMPRYKPP